MNLRRFIPLLTLTAIVLIALSPLLIASPVAAEDYGLGKTATAANIPQGSAGPATVAGKLIGYLLAFVGVIFFILMVYGGIIWMLSRGSSEEATKALEIIKAAISGIIIVFISYVITGFVLTQLLTAVA